MPDDIQVYPATGYMHPDFDSSPGKDIGVYVLDEPVSVVGHAVLPCTQILDTLGEPLLDHDLKVLVAFIQQKVAATPLVVRDAWGRALLQVNARFICPADMATLTRNKRRGV